MKFPKPTSPPTSPSTVNIDSKPTSPSTVTIGPNSQLVGLLLLRGLLRRAVAQRQREGYVDDGARRRDGLDPAGREHRRAEDRTDDARAGKQSVLKAQ